MTLARAIWLLPIGFILHDAEELLTMPRWIAAHGDDLARIAGINWLTGHAVAALPKTAAAIAVAILIEAIAIVAVTAVFAAYPRSRPATYLYAGILGIFVAHGVTHAVQPFVFGGYTPGVVTAVTVVPATGAIVYGRLFAARILDGRTAIVAAAIGAIVFVPLFAGTLGLARTIAGG